MKTAYYRLPDPDNSDIKYSHDIFWLSMDVTNYILYKYT